MLRPPSGLLAGPPTFPVISPYITPPSCPASPPPLVDTMPDPDFCHEVVDTSVLHPHTPLPFSPRSSSPARQTTHGYTYPGHTPPPYRCTPLKVAVFRGLGGLCIRAA